MPPEHRHRRWSSLTKLLRLTLRSSFSNSKMTAGQWTTKAARPTKIVTTDIPDPDNFLMILRVLKDNPDQQVDIVLSPRPVSFAAYPYGAETRKALLQKFDYIFKGTPGYATFPVGIRMLLGTVKGTGEDWIQSLNKSDRSWFYVDKDLNDSEVAEDTELYMQVSWLRLVSYLDAHGIDRRQYTFYWDSHFRYSKTIQPGCHHASHAADFTFDFDENAKKVYKDAVEKGRLDEHGQGEVLSGTLRSTIRQLCEGYFNEKLKQLGDRNHLRHFGDLGELIEKHREMALQPELYVGGPFTEALQIVKSVPVKRVVAMGGFIDGGQNIFANQFNLLIDMTSAREMLDMGQSGKVDLTLLPTECVKGSAYSLTRDEFEKHVAQFSPTTRLLYDQWDPNIKVINIFDLLAVMAAAKPYLYRQKQVRVADDGEVISFIPIPDEELNGTSARKGITMFWNERKVEGYNGNGTPIYAKNFNTDEHMITNRELFLGELSKTFR